MSQEQEIDWAAVKAASQAHAPAQGFPVITENPDIPAVIYRYCSVGAFYAMLTNRQLWLTDVHFINDSTEQTHSIEKAKEELEELRRGPEPESLYIQLLIQNFDWMALTPYVCLLLEEGRPLKPMACVCR